MEHIPPFIEVFILPITDSMIAQVAVTALFLLVLLDVLFGVLNACMSGTFSSTRMRQGISHKLAEFGYAVAALVVDGTIVGGLDLGFPAPVLVTVCTMLCIMELGSLMEIFNKMNPQLGDLKVFKILDDVKGGQNGADQG